MVPLRLNFFYLGEAFRDPRAGFQHDRCSSTRVESIRLFVPAFRRWLVLGSIFDVLFACDQGWVVRLAIQRNVLAWNLMNH
jgi:hypothetical protein